MANNSGSFYGQVFEQMPAGVALHEPETGRIERANRSYAGTLGYDPLELEGQSLQDLAGPDSADFSATIERAQSGTPEEIRTQLVDSDGDIETVTLELDRITIDDRTRLISTICTLDTADSSPNSVSGRRLEVALAGTDTGVWEWNMETDEVIWTESMEQLFGLEPGTFEGTFEAFASRVHPDDLSSVEEAIETAVETGDQFQTEYRIRREDGTQRWVHARGEVQETSDGAGRIVGIVTDISSRKENEQALRRKERQYRQLVERLPGAHYTIDSNWEFTFCNEALSERLGQPAAAIEGKHLWEVMPETEGTIVERKFKQVIEEQEPVNFEYEYESGDHWVSVQAYPYEGGLAAVSTDITDQREALRSVLDAAPVILYRFDSDGVFQDMRGEVLSRLGLDPDDLVGENIFDAYAGNDTVISAAKRALDGEMFRYTVTLGDITLETHYRPVYEDGEVSEVIGVSMDVTELQRQRERMEFFNSILRHDVLNGMTVIKMRAEMLVAELDGDHEQYAQTIVDWCDTTTEVTKRVRRVIETLATPEEETQLEEIDVSKILHRKIGELENAYPAVTFEKDIPDGTRVLADELLADVLGNVLTNSIEHNETDGLAIETTVECTGETVAIRIADDGVGVPDDRKESVFRRGETSHAKETGSGFGLFFVDVMVEKYGGTITIEDADTGGACFVIELPRGQSQPEER